MHVILCEKNRKTFVFNISARPTDADVVCHMAERGTQPSRRVPERLHPDQCGVTAAICKSQHSSDHWCLSGIWKRTKVSWLWFIGEML